MNVLAWLYFHWSLIESLYEIQYFVEILNIIRGIDKNIMGVYYSPSPQLQGKTIQKNCLEWADLLGNQAEILWQYWICTPWCCYFKSVCNSKEIENFQVSRRSSRRLYNFRMSTVDSKSTFINFDGTFSFHKITISNFFSIIHLKNFQSFKDWIVSLFTWIRKLNEENLYISDKFTFIC